jgi:hypothetical protein
MVNDELERMCQDSIMASFKVFFSYLPGESEENDEMYQNILSPGRELSPSPPG